MQVEKQVKNAIKEISRGSIEIIGLDYIEQLLERFYTKGERYIVKAGFDPTAPDLHLGHTILIQKLATFQHFGGDVRFLIGDFTAQIGDPSGRSKTRKTLSKEEVLENAKTYKDQVFKILDKDKTDVCFNSTWLNALGISGLLELASSFSVARMLERDDFAKRFKSNQNISILEFIYPLLQGYDSVALDCDIELGGSDQKFNLLMGRSMQRFYNAKKEQSVLMMPLLEGIDGVQKMSKSLDNYIALDDAPDLMYAKLLSISDVLSWRYFELLSSKSLDEINILKQSVANGTIHPKAAKEMLALEIVERFYNATLASSAKANFDNIFSKNALPDDMEEAILSLENEEPLWICKALLDIKFVSSTSEARRQIRSGALRVNQEKVQDEFFALSNGEYVLSIGKRKFKKLIIK
ncbi:MAG: tyrosine--tRNA ligase [Helicobacter sp.]|nr:tyrosine--tRNA ligase [Helicobacter sp.]